MVVIIKASAISLANFNLSIDFKNLPIKRYAKIIEIVIIIFLIHSSERNSII